MVELLQPVQVSDVEYSRSCHLQPPDADVLTSAAVLACFLLGKPSPASIFPPSVQTRSALSRTCPPDLVFSTSRLSADSQDRNWLGFDGFAAQFLIQVHFVFLSALQVVPSVFARHAGTDKNL